MGLAWWRTRGSPTTTTSRHGHSWGMGSGQGRLRQGLCMPLRVLSCKTSPFLVISRGQCLVKGTFILYPLQLGCAAAFNQSASMHAGTSKTLPGNEQSFAAGVVVRCAEALGQPALPSKISAQDTFDDYLMIMHWLCSAAALSGPGPQYAETPISSEPSASFRGSQLLKFATAQTWQHAAVSCDRLEQVDICTITA